MINIDLGKNYKLTPEGVLVRVYDFYKNSQGIMFFLCRDDRTGMKYTVTRSRLATI